MQGEISNGKVEMSQVFGEVVGGGQGPVAVEELELFGFDQCFFFVDEAGELDGDVAEFSAADDDVFAEEIAREIDAARPECAVGADFSIELAADGTVRFVGVGDGDSPEIEIEVE